MENPQQFNDKTLSVYANTLTAGIFKNILIVKKVLEKDTFPISFNERDLNIITNELLYYFLNICDKTLHNTYDHEIKTKIMDSLIDLNAKNLDEVKEEIMKERFAGLDQNNFGTYLKILRTTYDSQMFVSTYNKRQKEYEDCVFLLENPERDMDKALEEKYVELVNLQIWGIKENPLPSITRILLSIPREAHFYEQLCKVIPKIENQVGLSKT